MDTHVKVLGFIYIIAGSILVVLGLALLGIVGGSGLISGDRQAIFVTGVVGTALAAFFIILSVPSIIAGIGLLKRREWARILTIILGVFHLFGFPIGTAIGVYTLYVLLNDQTKPLFA
jgi:hypothetical protein